MPGTHVVFEAVVADHVTHSSLTAILSKMGKYVGYSSYGHRLGFGKFTLVNVDVAASEYIDNGDTRESDNAKAST